MGALDVSLHHEVEGGAVELEGAVAQAVGQHVPQGFAALARYRVACPLHLLAPPRILEAPQQFRLILNEVKL